MGDTEANIADDTSSVQVDDDNDFSIPTTTMADPSKQDASRVKVCVYFCSV